MLKKADIRIRDPFILTDRENNCYYMYGTTALKQGTLRAKKTFSVYKSYDLENFEEPKVVVDGEKTGFNKMYDFWAAEVHKYKDKYYLFGSIKSDDTCRATQIFVCDTPDGEFLPLSKKAKTPDKWECLDGTLYVENNIPYMVFSHEWVQVKDGEIWAVKMSDDLKEPIEEPFLLFKASDNPNVTELGEKGSGNYVTDGPFLYNENGKLKMIWSSFYNGRYLVLSAESDSIHGKWRHMGSEFEFDGGHAMIFYTLEGERKIALHRPNYAEKERAWFGSF